MNIANLSAIDALDSVSRYQNISSLSEEENSTGSSTSFGTILQSALDLVKETEDYSNAVEEEEIKYAMGQTDSLHDLQIAQQKATVSLQYTVAVKNTAIEAYKSIMNMQF